MRGKRAKAHHYQQVADGTAQRQAIRGLGVHNRQGIHGLHQPRTEKFHEDVLPRLQLYSLQGHLLIITLSVLQVIACVCWDGLV